MYLLRPTGQPKHAQDTQAGGGTLLCCVAQTPAQPDQEGSGDGDTLEAPAAANSVSKVCSLKSLIIMVMAYLKERIRKIENAFRKFDLNGDGFLSWDEFVQVCCIAAYLLSTKRLIDN